MCPPPSSSPTHSNKSLLQKQRFRLLHFIISTFYPSFFAFIIWNWLVLDGTNTRLWSSVNGQDHQYHRVNPFLVRASKSNIQYDNNKYHNNNIYWSSRLFSFFWWEQLMHHLVDETQRAARELQIAALLPSTKHLLCLPTKTTWNFCHQHEKMYISKNTRYLKSSDMFILEFYMLVNCNLYNMLSDIFSVFNSLVSSALS